MSDLKNRQRFSNTLPPVLLEAFEELKQLSRIPKSRLLDEAIVDLILKYREKSKVVEPKERQEKYEELVKKIEEFR